MSICALLFYYFSDKFFRPWVFFPERKAEWFADAGRICYTYGKKGCGSMKKTVGIGVQDFEKLRLGNIFYVDKTDFIRQWWEIS